MVSPLNPIQPRDSWVYLPPTERKEVWSHTTRCTWDLTVSRALLMVQLGYTLIYPCTSHLYHPHDQYQVPSTGGCMVLPDSWLLLFKQRHRIRSGWGDTVQEAEDGVCWQILFILPRSVENDDWRWDSDTEGENSSSSLLESLHQFHWMWHCAE